MKIMRRCLIALGLIPILLMFGALALLAINAWLFQRHAAQQYWVEPVRVAGITLQVPVPIVLRWVTTPIGAGLVDGRRFHTAHGDIAVSWNARSQSLHLRCAPCRLSHPALGSQPFRLAQAELSVHRVADQLDGTWQAGALSGTWRGSVSDQQIDMHGELKAAKLTDFYALFAADIPELASAHIDGTVALRASLTLPQRAITLTPRFDLRAVNGLGTAALRGLEAAPSCSRASKQGFGYVAAAVIAAEDQRFFQHHGYDASEQAAALQLNLQRGTVVRGGSTLTQQLARLMFVGADRSLSRKLRELLYAVEIEQSLSKAQILQLYLQTAPWGAGVCGAEAAAWHYFGKSAPQLSVIDAARLAVLLRNPSGLAQNADATTQRAVQVVNDMRGITRKQRRLALAALQSGTVFDRAVLFAHENAKNKT